MPLHFSENAKVFVIACLGLLVAAGGAFAARGPVAFPGADEHVHVHAHEGSPRIHAHTHPGEGCHAPVSAAERETGGNRAADVPEVDHRPHRGCSHDHDCHHAPFFAASLAEMRLDEYIPSFSAPLPALWQPAIVRHLPDRPMPPCQPHGGSSAPLHQLRTVVLLT